MSNAVAGVSVGIEREPKITCRVCAAQVDGFDRCWRCEHARRLGGVADVVARQPRTVSAPGAVACNIVDGARCDGSNFVMQCAAYGSDNWITCTGGNDARVPLVACGAVRAPVHQI